MALSLVERIYLQRIEVRMSETRGRDVPDDSNRAGHAVTDRRRSEIGKRGAAARWGDGNAFAKQEQLTILFLDGSTDQDG